MVTQSQVNQAIATIIGDQVAADIIADMGTHWGIVAALADDRKHQHPMALNTIRTYRAEQKAVGQ